MYSIKELQSFNNYLDEKGFPWAHKTVNVNEHIEKFLKYEPKIGTVKYKLSAFFPKYRYYLPPLFRGIPITVKSSFADLIEINNLTDVWTEKVRLATKKSEESSSPLAEIDKAKTREIAFETLRKENHKAEQCDAFRVRQVFGYITHEAHNFKLTWIKGLLSTIKGLDFWKGKRWLDISTGYGDRLLAAGLLEFEYYLGFDPNLELKEPIGNMIQELEKRNTALKDKLRSVCLPFEDSEEILDKEEPFDLVLSSPPFFTAEIYSDDKNQSVQRYQSIESWMKSFLFKSIEIAWRHLKVGGYLVLYVGDPRVIKGSIAEPMNLFIESLNNSSYEGIIGLENDMGVSRPCWVWCKVSKESERKLWKPYVRRSLKYDYPKLT